MIPGFGFTRRMLTLALCAGAFWAGTWFESGMQTDACRDAGGRWNPRGFCEGARP